MQNTEILTGTFDLPWPNLRTHYSRD